MARARSTPVGTRRRGSLRDRARRRSNAIWQFLVHGRWFRHWRVWIVRWTVYALALVFVVYMVRAVVVLVRGEPLWFDVNDRCGGTTGNECGAVIGTASSLLAIAAGTAFFVAWRLGWAKRPVKRKARSEAREYVPTAANSILDEVVGRDELCRAINDELKNRRFRRPHLLVGGVGAGKTAVLVRLTELLARYGAIPVPVRLRDVGDDELDFAVLARERFVRLVDEERLVRGFTARAVGEQAWRWLRKEDRIVVLADGLEEVYAGRQQERDRDNIIRAAIRKAGEQKLPLVIASRPHAPLRDVEAAVTELEPLSEEAALDYIEGGEPTEDEHRLDWIVETAEVSEAPLYLQVARQLYRADRLEHVTGRRDGHEKLDTRATDRAALRYRLLATWTGALADGYLMEELALTTQERREAVEWVSALACLGLAHDTIEVPFALLLDPDDSVAVALMEELWNRLDEIADEERGPGAPPITLGHRWDESAEVRPGAHLRGLQLAATWGEQIQLAEAHGDRVRFQHSLVQAYLGSRYLGTALATDGGAFLRQALDPGEQSRPAPSGGTGRPAGNEPTDRQCTDGPGRELLIALAFLSRAGDRPRGGAPDAGRAGETLDHVVDALLQVAATRGDEKALDLYAAALEIDHACHWRHHRHIVETVVRAWRSFTSQDQRGLLDAKLNLVRRLGEALRWMARDVRATDAAAGAGARVGPTSVTTTSVTTGAIMATLITATNVDDGGVTTTAGLRDEVADSYRDFFDLGCIEQDYAVRLALAEQIGSGGDEAFGALDAVWRWKAAGGPAPATAHPRRGAPASDVPVPGPVAGRDGRTPDRDEQWAILSAWLAPLLAGSVQEKEACEQARDHLRRYVDAVGHVRDPAVPAAPAVPDAPAVPSKLLEEIALAQGFKAAANRRARHPASCAEGKAVLLEQAEELLEHAGFWYTHLTLVHAFTLWQLPDSALPADAGPDAGPWRNRSPRMRVDHWLSLAGREAAGRPKLQQRAGWWRSADWPSAGWWTKYWERRRLHPFVRAAGELAVRALETGHPERYLWIDETGVIDKVGSLPSDPGQRRVHNLWIPPSTGWTALHRRAQQLVADVRLLLDLANRGDGPWEHARYLQRANRLDLPHCLTGDRRPMRPDLSVAKPGRNDPGSSCADGCPFELCPYPPRGTVQRRDLGEAFCRRQLTMLNYRSDPGLHRRAAPWQRASPWSVIRPRARIRDLRLRHLRHFWAVMADRRRVPRPRTTTR